MYKIIYEKYYRINTSQIREFDRYLYSVYKREYILKLIPSWTWQGGFETIKNARKYVNQLKQKEIQMLCEEKKSKEFVEYIS